LFFFSVKAVPLAVSPSTAQHAMQISLHPGGDKAAKFVFEETSWKHSHMPQHFREGSLPSGCKLVCKRAA